MVKSLLSLCLLKVSSEGLDYEDLPSGLVKELNLIKVFNGNYSFESENWNGSDVHQTALTILYDGVDWTFTSRSKSFHVFCCPTCDISQPDLQQLTVTEGVTVPATSPFSHLQGWLGMAEDLARRDNNSNKELKRLEMSFTVGVVSQDGTFGEIAFRGIGGAILFNSIIQVDFTTEGLRVLSHRGTVCSGLGSRNFFNNLYESAG